jgi:hypothetical protein
MADAPSQVADETPDPQATEIEIVDVDPESSARRWLHAIRPILTLNAEGTEPDDHPRVKFAWDQMMISTFERVARIMRSDLPEDKA